MKISINYSRLNWSRESLSDDELDENENTPIIKKSSTTRKKSYKKWTKDEVRNVPRSDCFFFKIDLNFSG